MSGEKGKAAPGFHSRLAPTPAPLHSLVIFSDDTQEVGTDRDDLRITLLEQ